MSLGLAAALAAPAGAATDFRDIPFLQARIGQVLERERNGVEVQWLNEATGNSGTIRVLRTYYKGANVPCRDYARTTRRAAGPDLLVRGTGCRDASGRWQLKEDEETTAGTPPSGSASPQGGLPPGGQTQGGSQIQGGSQGQSWSQGGSQGQSQGQTQGQTQGQSQGQGGAASWDQAPSTATPTPLFEPETAESPAPEARPAAQEPAPEELPIVMPTPSE